MFGIWLTHAIWCPLFAWTVISTIQKPLIYSLKRNLSQILDRMRRLSWRRLVSSFHPRCHLPLYRETGNCVELVHMRGISERRPGMTAPLPFQIESSHVPSFPEGDPTPIADLFQALLLTLTAATGISFLPFLLVSFLRFLAALYSSHSTADRSFSAILEGLNITLFVLALFMTSSSQSSALSYIVFVIDCLRIALMALHLVQLTLRDLQDSRDDAWDAW